MIDVARPPLASAASSSDDTVAASPSILSLILGAVRGGGARPPRASCADAGASGALTLLGMGVLAGIQYSAGARTAGLEMLIGSFAATAVLVYAAPASPLAQPRNVIGGHALSAVLGVAARVVIADSARAGAEPAAAALAVALSVYAMAAAGVTHPPGGATALIAILGGDAVRNLGWWYVLDVLLGASILTAIAIAGNCALHFWMPLRAYPKNW